MSSPGAKRAARRNSEDRQDTQPRSATGIDYSKWDNLRSDTDSDSEVRSTQRSRTRINPPHLKLELTDDQRRMLRLISDSRPQPEKEACMRRHPRAALLDIARRDGVMGKDQLAACHYHGITQAEFDSVKSGDLSEVAGSGRAASGSGPQD